MKILIISHFLPYPPHGGSLQRNFNLIKETSKNNEIYLLTFTQRKLIPDEKNLNAGIKALGEYCKYLKVFKISTDYNRIKWYLLLFLNLFSFIPYSVWRFESKAMIREIKKQLKNNRFDIIQIDTIALAQYANFASDLPKILVHQNVESSLLLRRSFNEKNPLIKLYLFFQGQKLRKYEKKVAGKFDVNITVSELDKKEFEGFITDTKFEVVPNGTDTKYFTPKGKIDSRNLVFVGGMPWYPNKDAMIYFCREVYPLIKEKMPDVEMHIIGRYTRQELQRISRDDKSIKLHGYVNDVRHYIHRAGAYVVPIRIGGGTRLKILDAFACGKAVVSTSVGCEGLDVTPGENVLIGDSPSEFADQVVNLLKDETLRMKLGANARKLVMEKYSWEKIGLLQDSIYQGMVK